MHEHFLQGLSLENELHGAIERGEIFIEFQPQFFAADSSLRGFEVLARWDSPTFGHVVPSKFISVAEHNGDIAKIGNWILEESIRIYMKMYSKLEKQPVLAVNVSVIQLHSNSFIDFVHSCLEKYGMNPANLELELTESVFANGDFSVKEKLFALHDELGVMLALDDFGTGYSSLSYLGTMPFDLLKIDKSFVDSISEGPSNKNLVEPIIVMAHKLGLKVIAEGVENSMQYDYLREQNCDFLQGFYLAKPLPSAAL